MKLTIKDFLKLFIVVVSFFSTKILLAETKAYFITTNPKIREHHSKITLHFIHEYLIPVMLNGHLMSESKLGILHSFMCADNYQLFDTFDTWIKQVRGESVQINQKMFHLIIACPALSFFESNRTKALSPSMLLLKKKPTLNRIKNKPFKLNTYIEMIENLLNAPDINDLKLLAKEMNSLFLNTDIYSNHKEYNSIWDTLLRYYHLLPRKDKLNLRVRFTKEFLDSLYTEKLSNTLIQQLYYLRYDHDNFISLSSLKNLYFEIMTILYTVKEPPSDSKAS